ncbi:MAG TPA: Gfo/Idh/MocA family oxidoreductase [Bacteroidetes bacterium]|nr:Gfo/Idh/MocA family oxidoreductase [Bacteroidota bacterium]
MNFKKIQSGEPVHLAFLGCGGVTVKHSKTLKGFKNVKLYYASRSAEKANIFNKKWKGEGAFGTYEAAISSEKIDLVLIATPPDSHLELALKAIRAGKHVIVEKPPFMKSGDFDLIAAEREKAGVQVMVAENYFYKPLLKKLKQLLATDLIGETRFLFFNSTKKQTTGDWRDTTNVAGGGSLFEGGIHWINFISNLGLTIHSLTGFRPFPNRKTIERSMQVVAKYEEGPVATLLYSWEIKALLNGLRISRIYGTRGSITFESNGVFIFVRGKKWKFIFPGFADIGGSKGMFKDFFKALRSGEEPAFNLAMAKRDLELVEEAYLNG